MARSLDQIDKKILMILQEEGRIPNVELADRIHLSATPCLERVRRLERDGYILGYRAELDPDKLDQGFVTFMSVGLDRTNEKALQAFSKNVAKLDEVVECHMVGGGFDYLLKIRTASMAAFRMFLGEKLSALPEVAQTHSYFVMEEVKARRSLTVK